VGVGKDMAGKDLGDREVDSPDRVGIFDRTRRRPQRSCGGGGTNRRGWNLANTRKDSMTLAFGYVFCSERSKMNIERLLGW